MPDISPAPRILCAEDETHLRRDICDELREAGYAPIEAANGFEALEQIDAVRPDLILCDINMPGQNGYEILAEVRQRGPELADTPFVFLTALADPREIVDGKRLGADDYLVKPIDFDLMLATVEARLRQVRRMRDKARAEFDDLRQSLEHLHGRSDRDALELAARALDPVAPGVVLLDGRGRVLLANRAARRMTEASIQLVEEQIPQCETDGRAGALRQAIQCVLDKADASGDALECLRLPRPGGRRELLAMIYPLETAPEAPESDPRAMILLSDPEHRARVPEDVLARLFDLTPTEARIALALAEGQRTADIARDMQVASTTVTFHLRNLFQKTNTHRQAELVALILAGSMTIALD